MKRIQRKRERGWRMPPGAVYVGRPTIFGNPWSVKDIRQTYPASAGREYEVAVAKYREELDHGGLLSDWADYVSDARWDRMARLFDELSPPTETPDGGLSVGSIRPLFRHLLRDATALVCWCRLDEPCHADVLIELLEA